MVPVMQLYPVNNIDAQEDFKGALGYNLSTIYVALSISIVFKNSVIIKHATIRTEPDFQLRCT